MTTLILLAALAGAPPQTAYDRAMDALRELREENDGLRARLAAAEPAGAVEAVTVRAGEAVHVAAPDEQLAGDAESRSFAWDFGDAGSAFNAVGGFNAAHLYDRPGVYTIALNGRPFRRVVVEADARPVVRATDAASLAAALADARPTVVELAGRVEVSRTQIVRPDKLLRGRDAAATLVWTGGDNGLILDLTAGNSVVRNVAFDSRFDPAAGKTAPDALRIGGRNLAVVACVFRNVSTAVNGNGRPDGILVQGCDAPLVDGLRAYLVWAEGSRWTLLGNRCPNSTRESGVRLSASGTPQQSPNCRLILLAGNDLADVERGDGDGVKAAIKAEAVDYCWAERNVLRGPIEIGPLGDRDGLPSRDRRARHVVFAGNALLGPVRVKHGTEGLLLGGNRVDYAAGSIGGRQYALAVEGPDAKLDYNGRVSRDLTLRGNTFSTPNRGERTIWIGGDVAGRVVLEDNLVCCGDAKAAGTARLAVAFEAGWKPGYASRNNTFPPPPPIGWPDPAAVVQVGGQNDTAAYLTPARWLALPDVSGDRFQPATVEPAAAVVDRLLQQSRNTRQ